MRQMIKVNNKINNEINSVAVGVAATLTLTVFMIGFTTRLVIYVYMFWCEW